MCRILISGANGFVGRQLCRVLTDRNYQLRAALRNTYSDLNNTVSDQIVVGNIGPDTIWEEALYEIDCVVHLAARVHVLKETAAEPLDEFRKINVSGTLKLAQQAVAAGVKRFVFISSVGVLGNKNNRPFTEQDILNPIEPYAISKMEAEHGLQQLATESGIEIVIIRPPLVYGYNAPGNFGCLLRVLNIGIPLPFGSVNNKRSLIALDNLVDLISICIEHPAAVNQIFLAGDGEDLSTTELLQRLGRALDKPAKLIPVPVWLVKLAATLVGKKLVMNRLCDSLQVDISKVRHRLGWKPVVTLDEALQKTANAYLEKRDNL